MATTVTSKGQVTIPKPVRDYLGLGPGSRVSFTRTPAGGVELLPEKPTGAPSALSGLRGHAGRGLSTDEIMALTRGEATEDDQRELG